MRGVRRWFRLHSVERDVDEEIAFHFAEVVGALQAGGLTAQAAREEASRQFGDTAHYRRQLVNIDRSAAARAQWRRRGEATRDTLKHALRGVVRSWALSAGIVLAFALGIGANATMYETVERMLLRPPPHIADAEHVRRVFVHRMTITERAWLNTFTFPDYTDLREVAGFENVAAVRTRQLLVGTGESAQELTAVVATASYWPLLGVKPALGRFYTEQEDRFGAERVVVLSHGRWQRDFGGRADAIGSTVDFGYGPYTVIGITPRGFTGTGLRPVDLFLPFLPVEELLQGTTEWVESRGWYFLQILARHDPTIPLAQVEAEATTRHRAADREDQAYDSLATIAAAPLLAGRGPNAPTESIVAKWLLGVASIVLIIACLNVANLLLARLLRQRREVAIRLALGISRTRLVAQVVAEGVLLGLVGGAAALVFMAWAGTLIQKTILPDIDWSGGPSPTSLLLVLVLSILAGALSAVVPAVQAARGTVGDGLRSGAGGITRSTARVRATLTVVQAALSVLLLVGAGLFVRSLDRIHRTDFGLSLWEVAYATPVFVRGSTTQEERNAYFEAAVQRLSGVPGVSAAGLASGIPFRSGYAHYIAAEGVDSMPRPSTGGPYSNVVDEGYFQALGVRVVRGRAFDARDQRNAPRVAIVNAAFAAALWPGEEAVGRCLYVGEQGAPCSEIVGVVQDARRSRLIEDVVYQYYTPLRQQQVERDPESLLLRIPRDMPQVVAAVQREMVGLDSRVRFARITPLEEIVAPQMRQWRLGATLFTLFGFLALVVAAIGMYSLLAFDVAQRVREIGLRTALGATRRAIMGLVMTRALRITAAGVLMGVVLAGVLAPRLRDMLYEISPWDPATFAIVVATLGAVSIVAAGIPAWRAAQVDPNIALKAD